MEIVQGSAHVVFPMGDTSRVGEARRHAACLSAAVGLDETAAGRLALIVNELGSNLVRHATGTPRLLLATRRSAEMAEVEVLAIDSGPGIADTARALRDGYSTGGTPGTGLGAVRRLADEFDLHSEVPHGTLAVARVRTGAKPRRAFAFGVAGTCAPFEDVSGDGWALAFDGSRAAALVVDGLGHGPGAAEAATAARAWFVAAPFAPQPEALELAHAQLRMTRGAALATALVDVDAGNGAATITLAGAGNIATRIVSGTANKTLLTQNGTIGVQMRKPDRVQAEWPPHALLVMHSDGVQTRWPPETLAPLLLRDPSLAAALLLRDHDRGRDDATVVVLRRMV